MQPSQGLADCTKQGWRVLKDWLPGRREREIPFSLILYGKEHLDKMRTSIILLAIAAMLVTAVPAMAELQNVEVGGSVRLRYNYINNVFTSFAAGAPVPAPRIGKAWLGKRAIGGPFNPIVASIFDWDDAGKDLSFVEQRTRLHVKADFTDEVSAFIEVDSYDTWGEDFRSVNYMTGLDGRGATADDVEIFQSYIEVNEMWGAPLRLRVGRQELSLGKEFVVGNNDFAFFFTGLSFDGVRLTYATDTVTIDAFATKLAETMGDFGEDDIDFYGIYGSCTAVEDWTFDLYWLLLREDADIEDFPNGPILGLIENWRGVDDYDDTMMHTVGLAARGVVGAFDLDAEIAYQFGEADTIGATFKPFLYGDDDADFGNFGAKLDVGYAFDVKHHPHLFAGFRYYGGEDNRDISFLEWLNPFHTPEASINFNRLFSDEIASGAFDLTKDLSNAWLVRAGVEGAITEKLLARFCVTYFESLDTFEQPVVPLLPWWTNDTDAELGWDIYLFMEYHYSEDLIFEMGWSHVLVEDGMQDGNFSRWNGYTSTAGTDDDSANYIYTGCKIFF